MLLYHICTYFSYNDNNHVTLVILYVKKAKSKKIWKTVPGR